MVQKKTKESNKDCKSYDTIDLVNCIFHFKISRTEGDQIVST